MSEFKGVLRHWNNKILVDYVHNLRQEVQLNPVLDFELKYWDCYCTCEEDIRPIAEGFETNNHKFKFGWEYFEPMDDEHLLDKSIYKTEVMRYLEALEQFVKGNYEQI